MESGSSENGKYTPYPFTTAAIPQKPPRSPAPTGTANERMTNATASSSADCTVRLHQPRSSHSGPYYNRQSVPHANGPTNDASFEDKLKHFMQESDSRMADNKMYADHRTRRRSR